MTPAGPAPTTTPSCSPVAPSSVRSTARTGRRTGPTAPAADPSSSNPYRGSSRWPLRLDHQTDDKPDEWVQSACVLCAAGCGLDIGVKDGRIVGVRGRGV